MVTSRLLGSALLAAAAGFVGGGVEGAVLAGVGWVFAVETARSVRRTLAPHD
jgi:hypothetical protein